MVHKAWAAGFSALVAVSAPTSLAVDAARRAGMTLVGFVRDDGFNVYYVPRTLTAAQAGRRWRLVARRLTSAVRTVTLRRLRRGRVDGPPLA